MRSIQQYDVQLVNGTVIKTREDSTVPEENRLLTLFQNSKESEILPVALQSGEVSYIPKRSIRMITTSGVIQVSTPSEVSNFNINIQ